MQTATAVSPMTGTTGVKVAMSVMPGLAISSSDRLTMIGVMTDCQRSLTVLAETVGLNDNIIRKICNDCACVCECCNKLVCRESPHCKTMLSIAMSCCQVCVDTLKTLNDDVSKMCMTHLNNFINCCMNLGIAPTPLKPQSLLGNLVGFRGMEGMGTGMWNPHMPMGGMGTMPFGGMYPQMSGVQWPMMGGMMGPGMMGPGMMGPGMMGPGMMGPGMMGGMGNQTTNLLHGMFECMRECLKCCESSNDVNLRKCCLDCVDVCECLCNLVCRDSSYCVPILNMLVTCCRSCVECCCTHDTESCRCCMMTCQNLMNCCNTVLSSCISSPIIGERVVISPTERNNLLNLLAECSRCCRMTCEILGVQNSLKKLLCDSADSCDLCFKMLARDSLCFHSFLSQCLSCCRTTMDHLRTVDAPACKTCWSALNSLCTAASLARSEVSK